MQKAIDETNRRRAIQLAYNKQHQITPKTIVKPIYDDISNKDTLGSARKALVKRGQSKKERQQIIEQLREEMLAAASKQDYEQAAQLRDIIMEMQTENPRFASVSKNEQKALKKQRAKRVLRAH